MSVLVEISPMSQSKHAEVMRLDITDVTSPLPEQVKQRWGPYKQRQLSKPEVTLEQIQAKMASAEQKRQVCEHQRRNYPDRDLRRDVRHKDCIRQHAQSRALPALDESRLLTMLVVDRRCCAG